MKRSTTGALLLLALLPSSNSHAQGLYFPPLLGNTWETIDPASLGWCPDRVDSLYDFLGTHHTKAFLLLKDGRIVLEHYFGTFTQDSLWYWASAGKTLTSTLVGIAQEEGYLDITHPSNEYLGTGWTVAPPDKEALITVRNQLTMTSGLDDGVADDHCTDPACLQYLADAGTRWAYHNGPYTLLDQVIENATGQTFSAYFNTRIRNPIGMNGLWLTLDGYDHVYFSKARSMARFGLLALNHMVWGTDTILHDQDYFTAATTPSQNLNNSYGYLWWLNGQSSFMLPTTQFVFPGPLMPNGPQDAFCALGKNDQLLNVVPSRNMVLIRMGDPANDQYAVSVVFNDSIWQRINALECGSVGVGSGPSAASTPVIGPNPCKDRIDLAVPGTVRSWSIAVLDGQGRSLITARNATSIDVSGLAAGAYVVRMSTADKVFTFALHKE